MTRIIVPLILISLAAACSQSDNAPVESNIDLIVRCGLMIDGLAENTVDDKLIVIRDQRISVVVKGRAIVNRQHEQATTDAHTE